MRIGILFCCLSIFVNLNGEVSEPKKTPEMQGS